MKNNDVGTPEIPHNRASIYYYRVLKKALMSTVKFYETRCSLSVNMEIVQMRIPRVPGHRLTAGTGCILHIGYSVPLP